MSKLTLPTGSRPPPHTGSAPRPTRRSLPVRRTGAATPAPQPNSLHEGNSAELVTTQFTAPNASSTDLWSAQSPLAATHAGLHGVSVGDPQATLVAFSRGTLSASEARPLGWEGGFVDLFASAGVVGANLRHALPDLGERAAQAVGHMAGVMAPSFAALAPAVSWVMPAGWRLRLGGAGFVDRQASLTLRQPEAALLPDDAEVGVRWQLRETPGLAAELGLGVGLGGIGIKGSGSATREVTWEGRMRRGTAAALIAQSHAQGPRLPAWLAAPPQLMGLGSQPLRAGDSLQVSVTERQALGIMPGVAGLRIGAQAARAQALQVRLAVGPMCTGQDRDDADEAILFADHQVGLAAHVGGDAAVLAGAHLGASTSGGQLTASRLALGGTATLGSLAPFITAGSVAALAAATRALGSQEPIWQAQAERQGHEAEVSSLLPLAWVRPERLSALGNRDERFSRRLSPAVPAGGEAVAGASMPAGQASQVRVLTQHRLLAGTRRAEIEVTQSQDAAGAVQHAVRLELQLSRATPAALAELYALFAVASPTPGPTARLPQGGVRVEVRFGLPEGALASLPDAAALSAPGPLWARLRPFIALLGHGEAASLRAEHLRLTQLLQAAGQRLMGGGGPPPGRLAERLQSALEAWEADPLVAVGDAAQRASVAGQARQLIAALMAPAAGAPSAR